MLRPREKRAEGRVLPSVYGFSSSARDTDFVAKLIDVFPDDKAFNICEGILRMRTREGLDMVNLMRPWEIYAVDLRLGHTCASFKLGHRLRLEVTSSCFPHWDRNTNSGGAIAFDGFANLETATQLVFR